MSLDPPIAFLAPPRARRSGRRRRASRNFSWIAVFGFLVIAAGCGHAPTGTPAPGTPEPTEARSGGTPAATQPSVDGLLVAAGGPLLVTNGVGDLIAFRPASGPVSAVTAAAGVIVTIDSAGRAARLESSTAAAWASLALPVEPRTFVRFAAIAPSGTALAIVAGDPQGRAFVVSVLDLAVGATRAIPVGRGLNGPPSWLGPDMIALDVIRDADHSGIATIDVRSGVVTDRPGPGSVVVSSTDGSQLAVDDPASGDVLIGDVASWEAGAVGTMRPIPGPPATGIDGLAMSSDGTRLAVVRRSDAGASIEILLRIGDAWRGIRTLTHAGDGPSGAAWLD